MACPCPPPMTGNNCPCGQSSYTVSGPGGTQHSEMQYSDESKADQKNDAIDFENCATLKGLVRLSKSCDGTSLEINPVPGFTSKKEKTDYVLVALKNKEKLVLPINVRHNGDFVELITPSQL